MRSLSLHVLVAAALVCGPEVALAKGKAAAKSPAPAPTEAPADPTPEPAPEPEKEEAPQAAKEESVTVSTSSAPPEASGKLPSLVFIEGGFRFDLGTSFQKDVVGRDQRTQNSDVNTFDPLLTIGALFPLDDHFRVGAAFTYGFNYADPVEENGTLGQLLMLDGRLEWSTKVTKELSLFGAPRAGLASLLPGGRLAEQITENQRRQFDTWNVPRIGFLLGADAGARYALTSFVNLRASIGYSWNMLFLMDSSASDSGFSASQNWQIQTSRLGGALGVEVTF